MSQLSQFGGNEATDIPYSPRIQSDVPVEGIRPPFDRRLFYSVACPHFPSQDLDSIIDLRKVKVEVVVQLAPFKCVPFRRTYLQLNE